MCPMDVLAIRATLLTFQKPVTYVWVQRGVVVKVRAFWVKSASSAVPVVARFVVVGCWNRQVFRGWEVYLVVVWVVEGWVHDHAECARVVERW